MYMADIPKSCLLYRYGNVESTLFFDFWIMKHQGVDINEHT